jgi:hypothetical protein
VELSHPFTVTDNQTGASPDLKAIALQEDWAKHLMYCDMDGFTVSEDGLREEFCDKYTRAIGMPTS